MIDERSLGCLGWARFSDDFVMRYRLARSLTTTRLEIVDGKVIGLARIVFLMLNPSTADAFKVDPTVRRCMEFARRWGGDVLEVVNLFAMRSPHPMDVRKRAAGSRGDDHYNDFEIVAACTGAARVIASWGNDGALDDRHERVRAMLAMRDIELMHLGTTGSGFPLHPLARGKHFIPYDREPTVWA